jgi:hypothetical protein
MATAPSIRVVKQFNYRGAIRTFSNRYHFTGGTPANSVAWGTFSDAIVNAEKAIYTALTSGGAKIIETVGYQGGSEVPVFTKTYTTDGTGSWTTGYQAPGDVVALLKFTTNDRSAKNHPIYCFNYFHGVTSGATVATADKPLTAQASAIGIYGNNWVTGFSDGTANHVRARPNGNSCVGYVVETYLTHRDLPR